MEEKEYVNIHIFDLKFLIDKASFYIRNLKNEKYSMKLWEDRIEEIKSKCNFNTLSKNNYEYELRYLKDIMITIYQKYSQINLSKVRELLVKEMGVSTHILPVKTDVYGITKRMIHDGEILGEIDQKDNNYIFKGLKKEKS